MSLNEIGGDLEGIQRFLRDLGGFWKIDPLFWGSFGLPMILGHFEGCPLDFRGFQRIPCISQRVWGNLSDSIDFQRLLLNSQIFKHLTKFRASVSMDSVDSRPFPWIPWIPWILGALFRGFRGFWGPISVDSVDSVDSVHF